MKIKKYRFRFEKSLVDMFLPLLGWGILCFISFGLMLPLFFIYILKVVINNTVVEHYNTVE
ncbi:hypothetical protein CJF42_04670 [Pseudoalteromonas sp. NBT06-2]|uniref:hypothetical protein n=1 Tax=Pseudoalteromonas sp. NBT06-2 TaxID=2025950 RepID=UPI000BA6000E|nr:hypothetical protein [Pseudoalteromonas sp. NBT06-2]PAJ75614.1 hypothetical protein CJF42_04670 [Pseudoalteromonas sp. NBT06-2]